MRRMAGALAMRMEPNVGPAPSSSAAATGAANVVQLLAKDAAQADAPQDDAPDDAAGARLAAALRLIERDFRRRLVLDEVARAAHLSPYHFHRLFRRHYGRTPKQLIEALRIAEVQRLLLAGTRATDAARAVGFAHQSHMTTRFRRLVGITPARWIAAARRDEMRPSNFTSPDP